CVFIHFSCLCSSSCPSVFFCTDPSSTEIYTLSLHDALPIYWLQPVAGPPATACRGRPPFRSWRRPRNPFFYQFAERTDTLAAFSRISGSCDRQPRSKGLLGGSAVVYRKWRVVGPGSHEADLDDRLRAGDEERGGWHDRFSSFHSSRSSPRYSDHSLHPARDFFLCCLARH